MAWRRARTVYHSTTPPPLSINSFFCFLVTSAYHESEDQFMLVYIIAIRGLWCTLTNSEVEKLLSAPRKFWLLLASLVPRFLCSSFFWVLSYSVPRLLFNFILWIFSSLVPLTSSWFLNSSLLFLTPRGSSRLLTVLHGSSQHLMATLSSFRLLAAKLIGGLPVLMNLLNKSE